jgi:hypothetical protein
MFLVEAPCNPEHPGFLVTHHMIMHCTREVGHGPTPWDDNVYYLSGDVINGSLFTIYQFPDNAFQLVNVGNAFYVPMYQRAIIQFNANPGSQLLGPFGAHYDVGMELLSFQDCVPIPHRYMRYCLQPLMVRQGIGILAANIVANGDTASCSTLLQFLLMAATICNAADTDSQLQQPAIVAAPANASLVTCWL